ncbi:MAG: carbon-nitrogen family hydrolase [Armatimonadota bacterium]|nr:carbon-nitrogen family hydrolase [Armatimonadota bacterium]
MKIIGLQLDAVWHDKAANHARVRRLLEAAPPEPGSLVILPEMFSTGFSMDVAAVTEGVDRLSERFLGSIAAQYGVGVLGGVVRPAPDGRGRNQAVLFGRDGSEAARYQKIHPFRYAGETEYYEPGGPVCLFDWGGFTTAPFICYDLRFPEDFRRAVSRGAQLFIVIANWPTARLAHWTTLLKARAIENQAYVVGVNRCGSDPNVDYPGHSLVIDPRGEILVEAGSQECSFTADLDLEALLSYRRVFPALEDMERGGVRVEGWRDGWMEGKSGCWVLSV